MNKNIILNDSKLLIVNINNVYTFNMDEISSRSPKLIIEEIKKMSLMLDKLAIINNIKDLDDNLIEEYAFSITRTENLIVDKNNNQRTLNKYIVKLKSINFTNIDELINYLQKSFTRIIISLLKYCDDSTEIIEDTIDFTEI